MKWIKVAFIVLLALTLGFTAFMGYAYTNTPDEPDKSTVYVSYWHIVHKLDCQPAPPVGWLDLNENPEAVDPYLLQACDLYSKYNRTEDLPPDMPVPNILPGVGAHFSYYDGYLHLVYPAKMFVWSDGWERIDNYNITYSCPNCKYGDSYFNVSAMEALIEPPDGFYPVYIGPAVSTCLGVAWVGLGIVAYKKKKQSLNFPSFSV